MPTYTKLLNSRLYTFHLKMQQKWHQIVNISKSPGGIRPSPQLALCMLHMATPLPSPYILESLSSPPGHITAGWLALKLTDPIHNEAQ